MARLAQAVVLVLLAGCVSSPLTANPPLAPRPTATHSAPAPTLLPSPLPSVQAGTHTVTPDPTLANLINQATADLAQRRGIAADSVEVKSAEPVEWRDSSLGCPVPGQMYAQVITPGYLIVLEVGGIEYAYHASTTRVMLCEN